MVAAAGLSAAAQATKPGAKAGQARRQAPAPPPPPPLVVPPDVQCPSPLGTGVRTMLLFCDVLTGRDPADGILVTIPPHEGTATLIFDLHNRHLYSEELVKTKRAFRQYTATIGALTTDNTLLSRAVVQSEFRTLADLLDRITSDTAPGAVKAVAPTGSEPVRIAIPAAAEEDRVSILGEKLTVIGPDGTDTFSAPGRPVAVISHVMLEYQPVVVRRRAPRRR